MMTATGVGDAIWTIGRLLNWTADYLRRHGVAEPRLCSELLLSHAAGCRRIDLYTRFDRSLHDPQLVQFRQLSRRAAEQEPVAYLVGEKEFFSLTFALSRDVLIPRPETETLVEWAIDHRRKMRRETPHLLDLGTGSGCIVIAVLTHLAGATAVGSDLSGPALAIARRNAERHLVADRLKLIQADGLNFAPGAIPPRGFDIVLCNPPYVSAAAFARLHPNVRSFEPAMAITDGGDGLSFYRRLAVTAPNVLAEEGAMALEVGDDQATKAIETIIQAGALIHRSTLKDRVTGKERVIVFGRSGPR